MRKWLLIVEIINQVFIYYEDNTYYNKSNGNGNRFSGKEYQVKNFNKSKFDRPYFEKKDRYYEKSNYDEERNNGRYYNKFQNQSEKGEIKKPVFFNTNFNK